MVLLIDRLLFFLTNLFLLLFIFPRFIAQKLGNRLVVYRHKNPRQLPVDCLIEILGYLENDTSTLHSCILANQLLCFLAIRILWKRPFENVYPNNFGSLTIRTYISCLSDEEKQILLNNDIDIPDLNQPFLDYPGYLQHFDCDNFISSIHAWLNGAMIDYPEDDSVQLTSSLIGNMICRRSSGFKDLRYLRKAPDNLILVDLLNYTGVNEAFSKLQRFEFRNSHYADDNFTRGWINLFNTVSISTKNLQHITIYLSKKNRETFQELDQSIIEFIRSQRSLKSISLNTFWRTINSRSIYESILHHSRSLEYLRIHGLSDLPMLFQVLSNCDNLKTLEFAQSWRRDDNFDFGNIIPSSLKINHLYYYFSNAHSVDFINTILRLSSNNLLSFSSKQFTPLIMTTINTYCPNITHLCVNLRPSDLTLFIELLLTTLKLKHLTIQTPYAPRLTKVQLYQLAKALPVSCEYFGIDSEINYSHLDHFLRNCHEKLKILTLHHISENHVNCLESVIAYAISFKSLKEIRLQKVNHNSDITEYQYKKWLNEQLSKASTAPRLTKHPRHHLVHKLKISEAKPISFSYHETVFNSKIINFTI
ncbi:unnamed protein product [Rhizophagus irregularis]|uniref:F-box domain-containing protein n=1 Tax=Rhizophagus irregularis TaxID=588596 RepID=A0A2N1NUM4_9GLOM|nr:hypothetical protein RhiirC2_844216 [Rhizophagus irregularis]CAB4379250.1 unnamed protein product [Rhizophagus irregularis]CAB5337181.1 unnamed protein product [Rhizophagus irregularis]CAB5337196.1 unnamed protein product [Rhizophagus irregularis]